jgi:transposase
VLREIARGFWLLVPARRLAQDLGLAERTVERRYRQLRRGIAQCRAELLVAEEPLSGDVEVDESYFGGVRKGKRGRGAAGKIPVFGLLKRGGTVRVALPERLTGEVLRGLIRQHVQPQSWVYTDGFSAYDQLDLEGFRHVRVDHSTTLSQGRNHINGIENFWAQAKRWLRPYSGGFKRNFALFILEAEFRFNHRNDPKAVDLLLRLLRSGRVGK